jgi:hypothetical protein
MRGLWVLKVGALLLFCGENIAHLATINNKYPLQRDIFCLAWSFAPKCVCPLGPCGALLLNWLASLGIGLVELCFVYSFATPRIFVALILLGASSRTLYRRCAPLVVILRAKALRTI